MTSVKEKNKYRGYVKRNSRRKTGVREYLRRLGIREMSSNSCVTSLSVDHPSLSQPQQGKRPRLMSPEAEERIRLELNTLYALQTVYGRHFGPI